MYAVKFIGVGVLVLASLFDVLQGRFKEILVFFFWNFFGRICFDYDMWLIVRNRWNFNDFGDFASRDAVFALNRMILWQKVVGCLVGVQPNSSTADFPSGQRELTVNQSPVLQWFESNYPPRLDSSVVEHFLVRKRMSPISLEALMADSSAG